MTPEERCYKILQDSNYIRVPDENPSEKIEYFLKASDGCPWLNPDCKEHERMFETQLKNWFLQFKDEILDFAIANPPTFSYGKIEDMAVNLHTMDDQGFEGQVMSNHTYYRWINDLIEIRDRERKDAEFTAKVKDMSDSQLEDAWQGQSMAIRQYLEASYINENEDESQKLFNLAESAKRKQDIVQTEITRRHTCITHGE